MQGAGWARCYTVPQTIVFGLRRERNLTRGLDGFAGEATGGVSEDRTLRLKPEERKGPSRAAREERTFQRARDKTPRRRQACPFFGTGKGPARSQENVSKRGNDATIPTEEALSRLLEMRSVFGDVRNSVRTIIKRIMPTCFPQMDTCANPTKVRAL